MKRKIGGILLAGALLCASLTGCGMKENEVVVTVNDTKVTADVANFYVRYVQAQYEAYYGAYLGDQLWTTKAEKGKTYEETVKASVLKELETMVLLEEHAKEYGVELTDAEKQVIKAQVKKFDKANGAKEKKKVSGSKKTVERVLTMLALQNKMAEAIQKEADTNVSDEEAAQKKMEYVKFSYQTTDGSGKVKNLSEEEKQTVKKSAEAFAAGIPQDTTDFDLQAYAAENGYETVPLTFDKTGEQPAKEVVEAADQLPEGGITSLIETEGGLYVAKVTSLFDQEATNTKKGAIVEERKNELYQSKIEEWTKAAKIKENKKVWKKIKLSKMSVKMKTEGQKDSQTTESQEK